MANPTHVTVTAPEGRLTPIHESDGVEPGGGQLIVQPGHVDRVRWSQTVRRARNRGDLILCNMQGAAVASAELAAAPKPIEGGRFAIKPAPAPKGGS